MITYSLDNAHELAQYKALRERLMLNKSQEGLNAVTEATPVDTGAAKASWGLIISGDQVKLTNDKDYIFYVNYGTSEIQPRHFIEDALAEVGSMNYPVAVKD